LAGGAAALVVASNSKPPVPTSDELVESSRKTVRVFELYSTPMWNLTDDDMVELAKLNAEAKGIPYKTLQEFSDAREMGSGPVPFPYDYQRLYFLPPGASQDTGPDSFTAWADSPWPTGNSHNQYRPTYQGSFIDCTKFQGERYGGSRVRNPSGASAEDCYEGTLRDFFWRQVGTFKGDENYGKSDLEVMLSGYAEGFKDIWSAVGGDVLKTTADIASNFPGIGTAVAAGATFLEAIGSGKSLEVASLAAARGAVPSTMRAVYDIGVGLATQGSLDVEAVMSIAMAAAIQQGAISGDVLEKYNQIKSAYEDAKAAGVEISDDLNHLGSVTNLVATATTNG